MIFLWARKIILLCGIESPNMTTWRDQISRKAARRKGGPWWLQPLKISFIKPCHTLQGFPRSFTNLYWWLALILLRVDIFLMYPRSLGSNGSQSSLPLFLLTSQVEMIWLCPWNVLWTLGCSLLYICSHCLYFQEASAPLGFLGSFVRARPPPHWLFDVMIQLSIWHE